MQNTQNMLVVEYEKQELQMFGMCVRHSMPQLQCHIDQPRTPDVSLIECVGVANVLHGTVM